MKKRLLLIAVLALLAALFIVPSALAAKTYTSADVRVEVHSLNEGDILKPGVTIYQKDEKSEDIQVEWNVHIAKVEGQGAKSWENSNKEEIWKYDASLSCSGNFSSGELAITDSMGGITASCWKVSKICVPVLYYRSLLLCPGHSHSWAYKSDGKALYAYCTVNDGTCEFYKNENSYTTSTLKVTFATPEQTYSEGTPRSATLTDTISGAQDGIVANVSYYNGGTVYYTDEECDKQTTNKNSGASDNGKAPVNAGTYYAKAEFATPTAEPIIGEFKIAKAPQSAAAVTVKKDATGIETTEFAWNNQEGIVPESTGTVKEKADVTYWYYYAGSTATTTDNVTMTDAIKAKLVEWDNDTTYTPGYYYMFAKIAETDNYAETYTKGKLFHVTGETISSLTVEDITDKTYGDAGSPWSIDVETPLSELTPAIEDAEITYSYTHTVDGTTTPATAYSTENPKFKDAGTYTVNYKIVSDNYYEYNGTATVVIAKKDLTLTLKVADKEYDGTTDATVTVKTVEGLVGSDSVDVSGITGTFDGDDAGERTATINESSWSSAKIVNKGTATENHNYKLPTQMPEIADADKTATIQPRVTTFAVEPETIDCDSDVDGSTYTVSVANAVGGETVTPVVTKTRDKATGDVILTVTGLTGADANGNYALPTDGTQNVRVTVNHGANPKWVTTNTTHQKVWDDCCDWVGVENEPHEWKNGVCTECGYVCTEHGGHTGGTANCTGRAICQYCGERYGEYAPNNHICVNHYTKEDGAEPEYWYCIGCNRYFLDENLTVETTKDKLVIAGVDSALRVNTATTGIPQTGDEGNTNLYIAIMLLSLAGMTALAVSLKKRKN